jgi:prophage regulatory protein
VDTANRPLRFLRFPAVRARTGLSRTTVWWLDRQGHFPRHRRISRNAVAWAEHEVANWIRSKLGTSSQALPDTGRLTCLKPKESAFVFSHWMNAWPVCARSETG